MTEGRGAEVRHAHRLKWCDAVNGVDGNDVRVLKPGECSRLAGQVGGYFQGDKSIGEVALPSEVDTAKRSSTEDRNQLEAREPIPDSWELVHRLAETVGSHLVG